MKTKFHIYYHLARLGNPEVVVMAAGFDKAAIAAMLAVAYEHEDMRNYVPRPIQAGRLGRVC